MQAASGWAPLSHAVRFAPVCICGSNGCASACGMGFAVDKGHAFKSARTAVLSPSRQAWPGCRAARSPGVVPRGPVTELPGRCLAIEPLLCRPPGRSSILFRRYVHFACANGRDSMDFRSPGRLRGESGPLAREVKADSWPKGACGSEANRGPQATRGSEAGRAFGLYCTNRHGRCACSGGQGRFPARGLLVVPKRFATWDSQRVSYIPWNQDGFRMPPMFGVE